MLSAGQIAARAGLRAPRFIVTALERELVELVQAIERDFMYGHYEGLRRGMGEPWKEELWLWRRDIRTVTT